MAGASIRAFDKLSPYSARTKFVDGTPLAKPPFPPYGSGSSDILIPATVRPE